MISIINLEKTITLSDGKNECVLQFPSVKRCSWGTEHLMETIRNENSLFKCQKHIGEVEAAFDAVEIKR